MCRKMGGPRLRREMEWVGEPPRLMETGMAYLAGIVLALTISVFATLIGFDRDRAFYPTVLLVIASYYVLFAVMGGSSQALVAETVVMVGFLLIAAVGFKKNLWLVVTALAAHGIFDVFHGHIVANPGVPPWWPAFCSTYDITAAAFLAWLLRRSHRAAQP
jgi:hypothetical protein